MFTRVLGCMGLGAGLLLAGPAAAVPALQLFIEGSEYQHTGDDPQTWAKVGTGSFRLWVIGQPDNGSLDFINDVRFVASWDSDGSTPILAFTPTTTGNAGGFTDPSAPGAPIGPGAVMSGDHPVLPAHGVFGDDRSYTEWELGNFTLFDSPLADFEPSGSAQTFPGGFPAPDSHVGQINVYDVLVSGLLPGEQVHFDVYGSGIRLKQGQPEFKGFVKAPGSHDARWEEAACTDNCGTQVPEPASLGLVAAGIIGLVLVRRRVGAA